MKKTILSTIVLSTLLSPSLAANASSNDSVTPSQLQESGVPKSKSVSLASKINSGKKTQADLYLSKNGLTTTDQNNHVYQSFDDGSFVEGEIIDVTPTTTTPTLPSTPTKDGINRAISDVGGVGQSDRILYVSGTGTFGKIGVYVRVYKPLMGTKSITSAYAPTYSGAIQSVKSPQIIRKHASAALDAYALEAGHASFNGLSTSVNLKFFLKDNGGYSSKVEAF